jgi:hypothetical protein
LQQTAAQRIRVRPGCQRLRLELTATCRPARRRRDPGSCATGQIALTWAASTASGPHADGQTLCFATISSTTLAIASKPLTHPVQNLAVTAPYPAYRFAEGKFTREEVFDCCVLREISVSDANRFFGPLTLSGGGGGSVGGAGSLEVSFLVGGGAGSGFTPPHIPAPAEQAPFCSAPSGDNSFVSVGASGGATRVVTGCSFANKVGTVKAILLRSIPSGVTCRFCCVCGPLRAGWGQMAASAAPMAR